MHLKKYIRYIAVAAIAMLPLIAAQFGGQVKFVGPPKPPATAGEAPGPPVVLPLPGATVTARQGDKTVTAVADEQGNFQFSDVPDGTWQLQVDMVGFSPEKQEFTTGTGLPGPVFQMKMLPLDQIEAAIAPASPVSAAAPATTAPAPAPTPAPATTAKGKAATPAAPATAFQRTNLNGTGAAAPAETAPAPEVTNELNQRAADGLLVNGSSQNGASTPFAQNPAFGNNRKGGPRFYTYGIMLNESNSALNAAQYSLSGQHTPKQPQNILTAGFNFGGPIQIPHLLSRTKQVTLTFNYSRTENHSSSVSSGLMPNSVDRSGDFAGVLNNAGQQVQIFDPTNDMPFANNTIPVSRFSPQALSLLQFYPQPNFAGSSVYNYQVADISNNHTDNLSARVNKSFKRKNTIIANFGMSDMRSDSNSPFNFLDLTRSLGQQSTLTYRRSYTPRFYGNFTYQFSRQSTQIFPFFSGKTNVEGQAGITGVNEVPLNWGPPSLSFAGGSGVEGMSDSQASIHHNQVSAYGYAGTWSHGRHNIQFGGDYKWQQFNTIAQSNPRGSFTFNGAATQETTTVNGVTSLVPNTGYDFADFLLGVPDTSSIAYGNADKYLRAKAADLFFNDDWKVSPGLSVTLGFRWEYTSPITEKYGRIVNLDIAPGFTAVVPVCGAPIDGCATVGPLSGQAYPASLIRPDKHEFEPRPALAWRPFPASSMVIRAGYGIAYNTQVYNSFVNTMAQQSPLSKTLQLSNATTPLTLANGFTAPPNGTTNTIAVDPNFKIGYAQVWTASVQRDLPGSLVMLATYTGTKGTHDLQAFVPNTYPIGAVNPCPTCPNNFDYYTSNANLTREAGTMNLRRRLHNGFTASVLYTYSKSIDDAATLGGGGGQPAQNWLNLEGERGLSNTDQRHVGQISLQYTSGMGMGGGTLLTGWRGKLVKDWTFLDNINLATGTPLTPTYPENLSPLLNSVRASYTGADIYGASPGHVLNPLAVTAPASGQFGNAGIDSITGPSQFSMNASAQRSFRLNDRFTLSLQINANNPLNHFVATAWGSNIAQPNFGTVTAVSAQRTVTTVMRLTF